jgi:hypothetical protein
LVATILVGLALAEVAAVSDAPTRLRLIIVLYAAVLAAMTAAVAYILHVQSRRASFLATLLEADTRDQDAFLSAVAEHPAIADLRIVGSDELAAYSSAALT